MIIDQLYKSFPNMTDLRLREIRVDKQQRKVFCTVSYPNMPGVDNTTKNSIIGVISKSLPKGYVASVKFANDSFTLVSFKTFLWDLILSQYPIFAHIGKEKIDVGVVGMTATVVFNVSQVVKRNMELSEFCEKLTEYFHNYTAYNVSFLLRLDEDNADRVGIADQEKLVQFAINKELLKPSRYFQISNVEKHIGKEIYSAPMYISDIRNTMDSCVVCGKVSGKTLRAAKNNPIMQVCKFTVTDDTGSSIPCIMFVKFQIVDVDTIRDTTGKGEAEAKTMSETRSFANDAKMKKLMNIYDGMSVVVRGKVTFNKFSEQLEMTVYDMCKCNIAPIASQPTFSKDIAKEYLLIKPEDLTEYRQLNFVDQIYEQSLLKDSEYVVLHANTTGFNVTSDKFVAICAVRLINGHISERLFTYVNPEIEVDDKLLEQCNVTQSKLIFQPTITEIVSDIYKFTYGSRLIGSNVAQILQLLNYYASPVGYVFDNQVVSQTELLSQLFENSTLNTNVNFAKLDDVAKKCKVSCPSSVFCKASALTVARCMSVLSSSSK